MKRSKQLADDSVIFGGSASTRLTGKICEYLNTQPGAGEVIRFSDGNLFVRVKENVRGRDVYLVQSTVFPTNDNFMELLFWIIERMGYVAARLQWLFDQVKRARMMLRPSLTRIAFPGGSSSYTERRASPVLRSQSRSSSICRSFTRYSCI